MTDTPTTTTHTTTTGAALPLNEWFNRLRQRKGLILIPAAITFAVCAALILTQAPHYRAAATVMIERQIDTVVESDTVVARVRDTSDALAGEVQILQSASVARAVVRRLNLHDHPQFVGDPNDTGGVFQVMTDTGGRWWDKARDVLRAQFEGALESIAATPIEGPEAPLEAEPAVLRAPLMERSGDEALVNAFRSRLQVRPVGQSRVLSVSFTADSPDLAAAAANAVAEEYIARRAALKTEVAGKAVDFLRSRIEQLRDDVRLAEERVESFRVERGLMDDELVGTRVRDLNNLILSAQAQHQIQLEREQSAKDLLRTSGPVALVERISLPDLRGGSVQGGVEQAAVPTLQSLRQRVIEARQTESDLAAIYGDRHPRLVEARETRRTADAALAREVRSYIGTLEAQARMAERNVAQLEQSLSGLEGDAMRTEDQAVHLLNLERDAAINTALYEDAVTRYRQIQHLAMGEADAWIVSQALVPGGPANAQPGPLLLVAALFSLGVGLAVFAVREMAAGGVEDASQIPLLFAARHLSTIALAKRGLLTRRADPDTVLDKPQSAFAEGLNTLAVALNLFPADTKARVLAITSCREGEGKSMTTLSLARLVATQTTKRVLVIECDLRKRTLGRYLRRSGCGLGEYLERRKEMEDCLHRDPRSGAEFLFAGNTARSPQNLLSSVEFRELIDRSRALYDLVLLDTPPLIEVSDTRLLSALIDDAVLLVKWRTTPRAAIARAVEQLRDQDGVLAGLALTQVDLRRYREYSMNSTFAYSGRYYQT